MKHSEIQNLLYDYAMNLLNDDDHRNVERHLSSCKSCAESLKELLQVIALLPHPSVQPSDAKDEAFWVSLTDNIEREIRLRDRPKPSFISESYEKLGAFLALRPAYAYAIGGSLAAIVLAVALFKWQLPTIQNVTPQVADVQPRETDSSIALARYNKNQERIGRYFRKSRTLLVGIANMKEYPTVDLSAERRVSRDLIHEARFIRQQPLNNRTERLVHDLEKILIELANTEEETDLPNVELIRSGIHQENLLFKIRMAEASFDTRTSSTKKIY